MPLYYAVSIGVTVLVFVAGLIFFLLPAKSRDKLFGVLRKVNQDMSQKQSVNAKHTKAARGAHDKAEAALFAVIKLRDENKRTYELAENAAEHLAQLCKGD